MTPGAPPQGLTGFLARRDALFANLTLEAATAFYGELELPDAVDPSAPLAMAHKARLQWLGATDAQLAESAKWLADNHSATMRGGVPLTPMTRDAQRMARGMAPLGRKVSP